MRYSDKFGRYLRSVRESKGYSQEYMAERIGTCQSSYANLESGRTHLTVERLVEITALLELDLHTVVDAVLGAPTESVPPAGENPTPVVRADGEFSSVVRPPTDAQQELIDALRSEIVFLRGLLLHRTAIGWREPNYAPLSRL